MTPDNCLHQHIEVLIARNESDSIIESLINDGPVGDLQINFCYMWQTNHLQVCLFCAPDSPCGEYRKSQHFMTTAHDALLLN